MSVSLNPEQWIHSIVTSEKRTRRTFILATWGRFVYLSTGCCLQTSLITCCDVKKKNQLKHCRSFLRRRKRCLPHAFLQHRVMWAHTRNKSTTTLHIL